MTSIPVLLRRLLVLVAAVVLAGPGAVELAARSAGGASVAAPAAGTPTAGRAAVPRPAAESQPADSGSSLRPALAGVVASGGGEPLAAPGHPTLVTPHLLSAGAVRPPVSAFAVGAAGGPVGRAPPGAAGT